jgi:hypothetical protein
MASPEVNKVNNSSSSSFSSFLSPETKEKEEGGFLGSRSASHLRPQQPPKIRVTSDKLPPSTSASRSQQSPVDSRTNSASAQKSGYNCVSTLKWIGVAIAVTAAVVGILGLLVYLGKLNIGWQGVGNISTQMGLYGMLGGLGTAAIIMILLSVSCCLSDAKQNSEQQRQLRHQTRLLGD